VSQLRQLSSFASLGPDLVQVKCRGNKLLHFLSPGALGGRPEPDGVRGDADHGGAGHDVAKGVRPPWVVVSLVHNVLPCEQLEEKDASTDGGSDDGPAGDEEVARVVANHVVHCYPEPPGSESPGNCDALEEHEEEKAHAARRVLVKQLEHVDSAPCDA